MRVKLINVAEYDVKDGKTNEIPFKTFCNLCGDVGTDAEVLPKVRLFKSIEEFRRIGGHEMMEINQEENVRVLPNGQFLVFLKSSDKEDKKTNATTDTEENTEK